MRSMLAIFVFIAMAAICWGGYAPVLHQGTRDMASQWRPFMCVGIAYFLIAVLAPGIALATQGEKGAWTAGGTFWSLIAGAAGALGALGIILALKNGGSTLYVMPLVFGGAPVVNTFLTMSMNKSYREVGPMFLAGLILVVSGAATVLVFRPSGAPHPAAHGPAGPHELNLMVIGLWTALTAASWGVYGPVLHKGQMKMAGSRFRPLMCVGLAYFLVAVMIPAAILLATTEAGQWTNRGVVWSLAGGAAGALGAIGIIMAFNFGGKPIYVMPLVFGVAPVVNTFVSIFMGGANLSDASPFFFAGLIIVAVGAVVVLVFAPKPKHLGGHGHAAPAAPPEAVKVS